MAESKFYIEERPWGHFTVLEEKQNYKIKKLIINPNQRISLQFHNHRDEVWTVVEGLAILRIGEDSREYSYGESLIIKKNTVHRIENNSDTPVVIIEIQTGSHCQKMI